MLSELAADLKLWENEWGSSSPKLGWSVRVKRGERIIVYLAPLQGGFRVSFAMGDKAVRAALAAGLPRAAIKIIENARKYAEGTAVRLEVRGVEDIAVVKKLAEAKLRN